MTPEWERFIRADEGRAAHVRETSHPCAVCKRSMIAWPGRLRHFGCEPGSLAGKVCTCPSGCSGSHWGDGARPCDPACEPCRMMRGQPLPRKGR